MEIRCSKLARPMVCAGFLYLDVEETEAGEAAKEGTAFGEYMEAILLSKPIGLSASNGVYFDDDMKFYSVSLAQNIFSRAASTILCEQRIDWQTKSGIWIRGSYDVSYVDHQGDLCIDDFKYGWSIVDVKENWQLLGYAIGEVIRRGQAFNRIKLRILQPRPHHEDGTIREWILSYQELLEYKQKIEDRMLAISQGERSFQTSKNCKYCPGTAEACAAFSRAFYNSIEVSMQFVQDSLTEIEISKQLDLIKRAEEILKIKSDSLVELGVSRIKKGKIIPNYIQTNKYGHRVWKPGITAESIKMMTGKDVMESVFMTPAKVEKLGVPRKLVEQLTVAPLTGVKLEKKNSTDVGNKIFGTTNPLGG